MLTHRELKFRFLNKSETDISSDMYFCLSSSCGFRFYERSKKAVMIPYNRVYPSLKLEFCKSGKI